MKIKFCTFLFCFSSLCLYAQKGSIQGQIVGRTEDQILYASVALLNASDSTLVDGTASDTKGAFSLQNIANGDYFIRVFYTGYDTWFSNTISLTKENNKIVMDTIRLIIPENLLKAAEVVATKPLFEMKHGTMTMNVDANPTATGENAIELLKKMPSVVVDQNDNISIEGKSGVTILIDDKPTYLSGEDLVGYLKSMPANTIEKIEVMKKPSARYDAQGSAGVINIVTKKEQKLGINGSVYAGFGYARNPRGNAGFNLTARAGKFIFSTNYSYYGQKGSNGNQITNINQRGEDTIKTTYNETDKERWDNQSTWQGHNFSFGTDYFINKQNVISLLYRGNIGIFEYTGNNRTRFYTNNRIDSSYLSTNSGKGNNSNHTLNLNYKHSFDSTGKDLHIDIILSTNNRKHTREDYLAYYYGNFLTEYREELRQTTSDPSRTNVATLKIDYEHPFNDKLKLEVGIKSSYVHNNNFNQTKKDLLILSELNNHFVYQENINALYAILNASITDEFDIQIGLRGEHTFHKGDLLSTGENNKQNYFDIFPNASFGYQFLEDHNINLGYRYSIYRPGYSNLNPFLDVSNPNRWRIGNPDLKPNYTHYIGLDYSWKYKINVWAGYSYTKNDYETYTYVIDPVNNIWLERPENIGKYHNIDLGITARFNVGKWWNMYYYVGSSFGQQQFQYLDKLVRKNVFDTWLYISETFTFLKNYSIEISCNGMLPSEDLFGRNAARFFLNAGFKANFLKNKMTARISVNDILGHGYWKENRTYPDGSRIIGDYRWESRSVWVSLSYRFGKQDIQGRNRRSDSDELDRIGGGGGGGKGQ